MENVGKVTGEGKFPCAVCRKCVPVNSILCQFCRCWVHNKCYAISVKIKEDRKFKCQTCTNSKHT